MKTIRLPLTLFLCMIISHCYGQDKQQDMSSPIEFTRTGWNKVLCMKNGNTMLFHLDPTMPVVVNVFDSTHKRVATKEYLCSVMDINVLRSSVFKGLFEVGGEAVLFIEQEHLGKRELVRLRFNGGNGKLVEEKVVWASPSLSKRTRFFVMNNKEDDNYAILFSTDEPQFRRCDLHVTCYNNRHEAVKEIPLKVDRKEFDYLEVVSAECGKKGILISLNLLKMVMNRTSSRISPQRAIYDHQLAIYSIPKDSDSANKLTVDVPADFFPYYSYSTYNSFAKTLNLLVFSYRPLFYRFGLDVKMGSISGDLFFNIADDNSDLNFKWITNDRVNASLKQKTDSSEDFYGIPLGMFTNENGLTTIVTEAFEQYDEPETRARYNYESYYGNIGITQVDDDGNELWGTVLPHSEYYKSYWHYYAPREIARKEQSHMMFDDLPEQITDRQFVSLNSYNYNNNLYLIFNDDNRNINNTGNVHRDTIYNFENTNACYYKLNSKREVTKNYLFGEPGRNEYKCSFIEGADFDEKRGVYATLLQYKRNDKISLRMAWRHLD